MVNERINRPGVAPDCPEPPPVRSGRAREVNPQDLALARAGYLEAGFRTSRHRIHRRDGARSVSASVSGPNNLSKQKTSQIYESQEPAELGTGGT
jgi:hypothetical protein